MQLSMIQSKLISCRRRSLFASRPPPDRRQMSYKTGVRVRQLHNLIVALIIVALACTCPQVTSQQEIAQPNDHPNEAASQPQTRQQATENPSQLFMSPQSEQQPQASVVSSRQSKQAEEEDGFIMRALQVDKTTTNNNNGGAQDEEATTTIETSTLQAPSSDSNPSEAAESVANDEGRIAINATRQQFLTHDQLLQAGVKNDDEQRQANNNLQTPPPTSMSTSTRLGMPRLAFASSFLSDFLFRPRQPQQQHQLDHNQAIQQQQPVAIESSLPQRATTASQSLQQQQPQVQQQQQRQHYASCPGVCLNIFVASLRCQNAIQAPCASLLQKCCEVDDVSFNGTPVETSAPLANGGDFDPAPPPPDSNAGPDARPLGPGQQAPLSAPLAQAQAAQQEAISLSPNNNDNSDQKQRSQQQAAGGNGEDFRVSGSSSSGPTTTRPLAAPQDGSSSEQPGAVYFLSSGNDESPGEQAGATSQQRQEQQQQQPLEQRQPERQLSTSETPGDIGGGGPVAQSAGNAATTNSPAAGPADLKAAASQSFDSPVTSTKAPQTATDRLVLIQTANGTTLLPGANTNGGKSSLRPLYANWTDYQLLMMQSQRIPTGGGGGGGVIYHSNIDPVRRQAAGGGNANGTTTGNKQQDDLINQNLMNISKQQTTTTTLAGEDLRVLKDQHASTLRPPQLMQTPISTTSEISQAQTTTATEVTSEQPIQATTSNYEDSSAVNLQTNQQGDEQQQQVSGIANFLGSLFDTFMSSAPATAANEGTNEARGPPVASVNDPSDSSSYLMSDQQNDRRLGLDLSFRQQNELNGSNQTQQEQAASSSGGSFLESLFGGGSGEPQQQQETAETTIGPESSQSRCIGYCSLDQFSHLCDAQYPSSDCGRSHKCCVISAQGDNSTMRPQQQQATCRGTCLPIYHSSLCMKPHEIQLDSPSCFANQFCCAQPTSLHVDGNNHLDETTLAAATDGLSTPPNTVDQATGGGGVHDASLAKDHSLSAALVPPPPPTILSAGGSSQQVAVDLQTANSGRHSQMPANYQQHAFAFGPPAASGRQQLAGTSKSSTPMTNSGGAQQTGGIMNQLFQMFRSNTGLGKQRPNKQQAAPSSGYNTQQQSAMHFDLATAAAQNGMQSFQAPPPVQNAPMMSRPPQLVLTSQATQQNNNNNGGAPSVAGPNGPVLIAPNGQPFVAQAAAPPTPQVASPMTMPSGIEQQKQRGGGGQQQQQQAPISLEQMAQFYQADPVQFAAMMQKQFGLQAAPPQATRVAQQQPMVMMQAGYQTPSNIQRQHPTNVMASASSDQQQQQQQATMMNYMNQQRLQPPPPQRNPVAQHAVVQHLLPAHSQQNNQRWTQMGQQQQPFEPIANNAQLNRQVANHVNKSQQQQQIARPNSLSFGPSDATNQNRQQLQAGWSGNNNQQTAAASQQQSWPRSRPTAQADANIVMAVQPLQSNGRPVGLQPIVVSPPPPQPPTRFQPQIMSSSRPPSSSTQAPPKRPVAISSAASNLSPVHASAEATRHTSTTATTPAHLDQNDETNESDELVEPCRSSCLSPMLAFNCLPPYKLDTRLACPTPGAVCCARPASALQALATTPSTTTSSTTSMATSQPEMDEPLKVGHSASNSQIQFASTSSDVTDDQAGDLLIASDQQPASNVLEAPTGAPSLQQDSIDQAPSESAPAIKSKVATACGLPGPSRRRHVSEQRARLGRVMGGFDSEPGYWCWQAALMNGKNEYLCGGALIGTKWVLTAAHCVTQHLRSESQLFVRLGQWNLNSSSPLERRSARSLLVKTSYVHHNHNGVTLDNDIALLRLEEAVDLDEPSICTVCLPERRPSTAQLEVGKRCTVTGYGFDTEAGPAALRVRQTDLPLVADAECQNKTSLVLGKPFVLPASSFCAGGELGQDACHGDGGSPLSCLVDGFYELTGIVSWGYKCGNKDLPGLYAKVSNFVGWINQIVSVNS